MEAGPWLTQCHLTPMVVTVATPRLASRRVAMTTSLLATVIPRQQAVSLDTLIKRVSDNN